MFTATTHQFCHPSSGNKLEAWVWVKIHGAFSQHFWSQNHARLFPILPFTSLLCLAFTLSRHLKNENSMFIIIHENSLDMEKVSLFFPQPFHFCFFWERLCYSLVCWTDLLPLNSQEDNHLHQLYWLLSVGWIIERPSTLSQVHGAAALPNFPLLWYKITHMLSKPGQPSTVQAAPSYRVQGPHGMNRDAVCLLLSQPRLQCCCLQGSVQHISVLDWALLNAATVNMLLSISAPPNYMNWDGTYCSWHNIIDHYLVILLWDRQKILFYFKYQ